MFSFRSDAMSDEPTLVKVLRYLRGNAAPSAYNDIISAVGEGQALVDRALGKLVAQGIVENGDEGYCYLATARAEELCQKLFALYEQLAAQPRLELLARGLLCQASGYYLLRMNAFLEVLEEEGFPSGDVTRFLDGEIERGYVKRTRGSLAGLVSISAPMFVPSYYALRGTGSHGQQQPGAWGADRDCLSREEDYLIGVYPPEVAEPAIQYVETQKPGLSQVLKAEAYRQWYVPDDPATRLR